MTLTWGCSGSVQLGSAQNRNLLVCLVTTAARGTGGEANAKFLALQTGIQLMELSKVLREVDFRSCPPKQGNGKALLKTLHLENPGRKINLMVHNSS